MPVWFTCISTLYFKPSPWLSQKAQQYLGWLPPLCHKRTLGGFTLAELLICIAILGVIAVFTIPKIIVYQQNQQNVVIIKETVAAMAGAYQAYQINNTVTNNTGIRDLTPYINYTAITSTNTIDDVTTSTTISCGTPKCLKLHSGAYILYWPSDFFNGNTNLNGVPFLVDPDGHVTDGTTNGPGKSIMFFLYRNGKIRDRGTIDSNTIYSSGGSWSPDSTKMPSWFSW